MMLTHGMQLPHEIPQAGGAQACLGAMRKCSSSAVSSREGEYEYETRNM